MSLNIYQSFRYNKIKEDFKNKEREIREDAIKKSKSVTRGQVTEQVIPLLPIFPYEPGDAKFLGQPVDYLIFKGMNNYRDTGEGIIEVIFLEVKTGRATRTKLQNRIKDAIEKGQVKFETIKLEYGPSNQTSDKNGENA